MSFNNLKMYPKTTTAFVLSLLSIPFASAGQHTGSHFRLARRHHARMVQNEARQASCEEAAWQCSGSELQRESFLVRCRKALEAHASRRVYRQSVDLDPELYRPRHHLLVSALREIHPART